MNRYPAWLNALVVVVMLIGILFALPNMYGTAPAIQLAKTNNSAYTEAEVEDLVAVASNFGVAPENAFVQDDRAILQFADNTELAPIWNDFRSRYDGVAGVSQTKNSPKLPEWIRTLGLAPMSLGLDLRGGIYVLLEVDMATAVNTRLALYQESLTDSLRDGAGRHRVEFANQSIRIRLNADADLDETRRIVGSVDPDLLISDGADGKSLTVRMSAAQIKARQDFAIEQNITTLRNRVNILGVAEPLVQRQGVDRIVVQLPGVEDPTAFNRILTATATIEFRMVDVSGTEPGTRRYEGRDLEPSQFLKRKVIASGDQIIDASAGFSEGQPQVNITLDSVGGESMLNTTLENLGKLMSTVFIETDRKEINVGGEIEYRTVKTEEIISSATIQGVFKDRFRITGLSPGEASDLALLLRAGALAAPVYKIDERTIGPSLGQDNIDRGFEAIKIGFLAVIVFMAIYYRAFGLVANLALFTNLVFIVAVLSWFQASLTLPGIAGIVLTVGMAVDANVLIFERIREELSAGQSPQLAIHSGYEKALSSIADANITTLIAAIVLFAIGTGAIKGFAITLAIGILTSMFTAIIGTRSVVNLIFGGRKITSLPV